MGRIVALDYGKVRTGIAVTDELQLIASGLTTVHTQELLPFLIKYVENEVVDIFVVGQPWQMNNTPSESEVFIQEFIRELEKALPNIPVRRQDERFTSKMAVQSMVSSGMKKKKRQNKGMIDEISATLILQAFLNKK